MKIRILEFKFERGFITLSVLTLTSILLLSCGRTTVKKPVDHQITDLIPKDAAIAFLSESHKKCYSKYDSGQIFTAIGVKLWGGRLPRLFKYEDLEYILYEKPDFGGYYLLMRPKGQSHWASPYWHQEICFPHGDLEQAKKASTAIASLGASYNKKMPTW